MENDEIYLLDMWRILVREWRWLVGAAVVVTACAFALSFVLHPKWEAEAWIRPGQLGLVPSGQDPRPEPFQRVVDRMQTLPFQDDVLHDLGIPVDAREGHLYRKSLVLLPSPYAGLIRFTVRGYSRDQAIRFANATVAHLHALHAALMAQPWQQARDQLHRTQAQLDDALSERNDLRQAIAPASDAGGGRTPGANPVIASLVLNASNQEVRGLQQAAADAKQRLTPAYSYETGLAWPVYAAKKPVYPNRALIWGGGLVLGLGLGVLAAVARNARRRAMEQASPA